MSSFIRIAGAAAVVLSLGFLVSALPAARASIPAITGTDAVSVVCAKLAVDIEAKILALAGCGTIAELTVAVHALVAAIQICANDLLRVGAGVVVDVEAKASIVACLVATITLLAQVCVQVSVKFGLTVVAALFAEIDVVVRLLLVNLNICVGGIVALIAKALASVTVGLIAQIHLKLCLGVLGLAGVTL
ncbi:hypothetical protein CTheo_8224 [Ceratobasidium theobromae]|uniref:Transmembrane protein n=1 Tax=Ceratobasidium theobromae TaxID=1582974 RepID=A0A5N5QA69_9AGAM|nr:hypothetical protein CTheo_8224 [Ceratobasidium theobromae]